MTETAHTPGPWLLCAHLREHDKCSCGYRGGIWGADGEKIICEMGSQPTPGQEGMEPPRHPREVEFANALLIAAAPDMLEALKDAAFSFGSLGVLFEPGNPARDAMQEAKGRIRAAIAKAEKS